MALLLLIAWAVAPQALDLPLLLARLGTVRPLPLALAIALQATRYLGTGFLMSLFSACLGVHAPRMVASQVAVASSAAARVVPVAGAGGVAVRYAFLRRCGLGEAAIGGYFLLQNVLGTATLLIVFVIALAFGGSGAGATSPVPGLLSIVAFAAGYGWLRTHPDSAARTGRAIGQRADAFAARLNRQPRLEAKLARASESLVSGLTMGGAGPWRFAEAFLYSSWTIVGDIASLHVCGIALGAAISPAATVVAYGFSSFAASAMAMPAGLGVTEGALTAVYAGFGEPIDLAVSRVILFRLISFWLPIALGLLAGLDLKRRGKL